MKKSASINSPFKRCPPGTFYAYLNYDTSPSPSLSNCWSKQQWQDHILDGAYRSTERAQSQRRHHQALPSQTRCSIPKRWAQTGHPRPKPNRWTGPNVLDEPVQTPPNLFELVDRFYAGMDVVLVESWCHSVDPNVVIANPPPNWVAPEGVIARTTEVVSEVFETILFGESTMW